MPQNIQTLYTSATTDNIPATGYFSFHAYFCNLTMRRCITSQAPPFFFFFVNLESPQLSLAYRSHVDKWANHRGLKLHCLLAFAGVYVTTCSIYGRVNPLLALVPFVTPYILCLKDACPVDINSSGRLGFSGLCGIHPTAPAGRVNMHQDNSGHSVCLSIDFHGS